MDDTDNDLSDDELNDSDEDSDTRILLPCDHPSWEDVSNILQHLSNCHDSSDIVSNLSKLSDIVSNETPSHTLQYFLEHICDPEEKEMLCTIIIPAIASLALEIPTLKPFIGLQRSKLGEVDIKHFHPDFVSSLLAHSFLSTSGKRSFNLDLNSLKEDAIETHWKLRCYFSYFHHLLQPPSSDGTGATGSRFNLTVFKEVSSYNFNQEYFDSLTETNLINLVIKEDLEEVCDDSCIKLTFCEDFNKGFINAATPLDSEFTLKHLENLLPFLIIDELSLSESIRTSIPGKGQLSLIKTPQIDRSCDSLLVALETLFAGIQPCTDHKDKMKSLLRRPSVAAVTSCDSDSVEEGKDDIENNSSVLSFSDSCVENNNTESELSYSLSKQEKNWFGPKNNEKKRNKTRKKESFNDRLKAAMERGNTPDESEADVSTAPKVVNHKKPVSLHKRIIRRQRSTGFRAFNDNVDDSEEFFTATEDERSFTPARGLGPVRVNGLTGNNSSGNLVMRRKLLQDKSFDMSVASSAHITSPSPPLTSNKTDSSHLCSDSDSFSSDGLGMPRLEDECLEDLYDKLQGCLETSENNLEFRNMELRRAVRGLRLRSLSESFSTAIGDLDLLSSMSSSLRHTIRTTDDLTPSVLTPSLSCPHLSGTMTELRQPCPPRQQFSSLVTHNLPPLVVGGQHSPSQPGGCWVQQIFPILIWIATSCLPNYQQITFQQTENVETDKLKNIVGIIAAKKLSVAKMFSIVRDFVDNSDKVDFYTFVTNKLQ